MREMGILRFVKPIVGSVGTMICTLTYFIFLPTKVWEYVFTGVGLSVSLFICRSVTVRSFVRYCGQGSSLLSTPALRPLCRSNAPAQGEEGNW